ncbi:MAG: hypothetical protein NC181_02755 [Clostridium sp.]|nr:hypothetical protein [Clostridium sp.]MCM1444118.1 hypothetical protein [Candidatus Amulumruptor caecigallinarius]
MKKAILLIALLLVSGCTVVRIDTESIDNIVDVVLSKNNTLYNQIGKGYKYYIPRGVSYIETTEYNDTLYSEGNYYYLYIDAIAYYYDETIACESVDGAYYFREINNNDKTGYLLIKKMDNKYLVEFVYNYAKIEALVEKSQINDVVLDSSYILSTIKYNYNVIKIMLDSDYFKNKEEKYTIFESQPGNESFFPIYEDDGTEEKIDENISEDEIKEDNQ